MNDVEVLARTIWGEARGEGERGMIAVGCVIRNRVNADLGDDGKPDWWGEGYEGVCRKPWQFSCWNPNDPNLPKLLAADENDPQFGAAVRIANGIVVGAFDDPTLGSTHYFDTRMPKPPRWAVDEEPMCVIGHHAFYRMPM